MPWRIRPDGLEVRVRVTPRGGRDAIDGVETLSDGGGGTVDHLPVVRLDQGVRRLLAKALKVPASAVSLEAGATARLKIFSISGEGGMLAAALAKLTGRESP